MMYNYRRKEKLFISKSMVLVLFGTIALYLVLGLINICFNVDTLIMLVFFSTCFIILKNNLRFVLKYTYYFYYVITNLIGVYIIENNTFYLTELGTISNRRGTLFFLAVIHSAFLYILFYIDKNVEDHISDRKFTYTIEDKKINQYVCDLISVVFLLLTLYMFFRALKRPAFMMGLDRFQYADKMINGFWRIINNRISMLFPFVLMGIIFKRSRCSIIGLVLFVIYAFLIGHKMGIFLTLMIMSVPMIVIKYKEHMKTIDLSKFISYACLIGICLISILYLFMHLTYNADIDSFKQYLYQRIAQQGQMWWAIFGNETAAHFHFNEIIDEVSPIFNSADYDLKNYGIYKMMKLVTPGTIYSAKINAMSRYAASSQASIFYYFNEMGFLIFIPLSCIMVSFFTNWYWKAIRAGNILNILFSSWFYQIMMTVFSQSDFLVLLDPKKIFILFVFIFINSKEKPSVRKTNE